MSLRGQFLVAEPRLPDSNFFRSVVLVLEHSGKGASGLILNRPSSVSLQEVWSEVSDAPLIRHETIYIGGPVEGPLGVLHTNAAMADQTVMDGVYLSLQREKLDQLMATESGPIRVFSGYSGWSAGQLESEMEVGGWFTWPAEVDEIFGEHERLYRKTCERVGQSVMFGQEKKVPKINPTLN